MNILEAFNTAGICFGCRRLALIPEIPHVADVLYVMGLSDEQKYYDYCSTHRHATYIVNVGIVIAAVGHKVLGLTPYDEAEARRIIAEAILALCPPEAKCLFIASFAEAKQITGQNVPSDTADIKTVEQACGCAHCKEVSHACDDVAQYDGDSNPLDRGYNTGDA